jgi:hypothetical protein
VTAGEEDECLRDGPRVQVKDGADLGPIDAAQSEQLHGLGKSRDTEDGLRDPEA